MALDLTPVYEAVIHEVNGPGGTYLYGDGNAYIAQVSDSLAVLIYAVYEDLELRIRAFHPDTGSSYYDDQFYNPGTWDVQAVWIAKADTTTAFGVVRTSASSGTYILFKADSSGWSTQDYTGVSGFPDRPQADGASGFPYFWVPSTLSIWTADLSDLSRTITTVTLPTTPTNLTGIGSALTAWRGGVIAAGRDTTTNGGVNGHFYWYQIGTGFVDYTVSGLSVRATVTVATGERLWGTSGSSSVGTTWEYDATGDSFSTSSPGYREHTDGDLTSPDLYSEVDYERISLEDPWYLAQGGNRLDEDYDSYGQQDPYKAFLHVTDATGDFDFFEFEEDSDFAPDPVNFYSFLNFQATDLDVQGDRFAAVLIAEAGNYDPTPDDVYWHTVIKVVCGTLTPTATVYAWRLGRLGGEGGLTW